MSKRTLIPILFAIAVALPALFARVAHPDVAPTVNVFIYGAAVVALFALQLAFPKREVRLAFTAIYAVVALFLLVRARRPIAAMFRHTFGSTRHTT